MICAHCNKETPEDALVCSHCGRALPTRSNPAPRAPEDSYSALRQAVERLKPSPSPQPPTPLPPNPLPPPATGQVAPKDEASLVDRPATTFAGPPSTEAQDPPITCPYCHQLAPHDAYACKRCGTALMAPPSPAFEPAALAKVPNHATPTTSATAPSHSTDAMRSALKKCPFCAEQIRAEATFCRFCRRDIPQPSLPDVDTEFPTHMDRLLRTPPSITPQRPPSTLASVAVSIGLLVVLAAVFVPFADPTDPAEPCSVAILGPILIAGVLAGKGRYGNFQASSVLKGIAWCVLPVIHIAGLFYYSGRGLLMLLRNH